MSKANFYPVIHVVENSEVNKTNLKIAFDSGADGTFLINHGNASSEVFEKFCDFAVWFLEGHKNFKLGANCLGKSNLDSFNFCQSYEFSMMWSDNAGFDFYPFGVRNAFDQADFYKAKFTSELYWYNVVQFFGGVHFKYQAGTKLLIQKSIEMAWPYVDVVTLSGEKTGSPPDLKFIEEAVNSHEPFAPHRFAIASGINKENAKQYLPFVRNFLVASSILEDHNSLLFSAKKTNELCKEIKNDAI